jgi:alpha-galactosidase
MEAWVTDSGEKHIPLSFKFHVSMCGSLGIGGHLLRWTPEECQGAARHITLYKKIRPIIQFGDLYRLRSPQEYPYSAVQYMSKDKSSGVLFAFRTHMSNPAQLPVIRLQGLEPEALYTIEGVDFKRSGAAWMEIGVLFDLKDYESRLCRIQQI